MNIEFNKNKCLIEALLFAWGEPIEIKEIAKYLNVSLSEIIELIDALESDYSERGIRIQKMGTLIQLNTSNEYSELIQNFGLKQKKKNLSNAAMETLSIIAYLQPTTKQVIEQIRGVKSEGSIKTLMDKELIYEAGNLNQPGKPIVYKTTDLFLKSFEIKSLDNLPDLVDRDEILELLKITEIDFNDIILNENQDSEINESEVFENEAE